MTYAIDFAHPDNIERTKVTLQSQLDADQQAEVSASRAKDGDETADCLRDAYLLRNLYQAGAVKTDYQHIRGSFRPLN